MMQPAALVGGAAAVLVLGAFALTGVQTVRLGHAERRTQQEQAAHAATRQAWAEQREAAQQAAHAAVEAARTEEHRRQVRQQEAADAAQITRAQHVAAQSRADIAGAGLRDRAAKLAAACGGRSAADTAPAGERAAAESAGRVLAELLGRAVDRARILAATADERGAAGTECERRYDALIPLPTETAP